MALAVVVNRGTGVTNLSPGGTNNFLPTIVYIYSLNVKDYVGAIWRHDFVEERELAHPPPLFRSCTTDEI